ncbi:MAG: hypothetical protein WB341_11210 [Terracidiphilus sp.]
MHIGPDPGSPRSSVAMVVVILGMIALPAALTLSRVRVSAVTDVLAHNPSPYGYTVSLLLFIVPILAIGGWLVPSEKVRISKKSFVRTIALLFPLGLILDFFFAHLFLKFPNLDATLHIPAPALGDGGAGYIFIGSPGHIVVGSVPIEEYVFYFTGFVAVLLLYIWLDEYWLAAYSVPSDASERTGVQRLLRFHPQSLLLAAALILAAIAYRQTFAPQPPGFPGYFTFLVAAALGPSTALFPAALPVINWRAFSMTLFVILLTSLLWEATLAIPYGWWGYQPAQMMGIRIVAWDFLPIEAICVWIAVTYQTVIVYEIVKCWQSSGKTARRAFLG